MLAVLPIMKLRAAASASLRQATIQTHPLRRQPGGGRSAVQPARWQSTGARDAAHELLRAYGKKSPVSRTERLDGVQLQKLSLTLGRRELWPGLDVSRDPPPADTPVPAGYHLVYFTPAFVEADLGRDGTDKSFNPPAPFTRRMCTSCVSLSPLSLPTPTPGLDNAWKLPRALGNPGQKGYASRPSSLARSSRKHTDLEPL